MGVMAQWRTRRWEVSHEQITAITSISASKKLKTERGESRSGSSTTVNKGFEPENIPVSYDVSSAVGVDPRVEYEAWVRQTGKTGTLLVGGKRLGPRRLMLDEVSLDVTQFATDGNILLATIGLTFTQDGGGSNAAGSTTQVLRTSTSSGESSSSALRIGPSAAEKKRMKG